MTTKKQAPLGKSTKIGIPSQNLIRDPRAKSSIRGSGARIPTGDNKNSVPAKQKKPYKVTWF